MVTHLKKAVIVVCFLTFETLLEAWATAAEGAAPAPLAPVTHTSMTCSSGSNLYSLVPSPPKIYTPLALLGVLPKSIPRGIHFGGGSLMELTQHLLQPWPMPVLVFLMQRSG